MPVRLTVPSPLSSSTVTSPMASRVGASLTAVTVTVAVALSDMAPPLPALPWSSAETVRVMAVTSSAAGCTVTPAASARVAARAAGVAVTDTEAVPLLVTSPAVTPPATAVETVTVPLPVASVTARVAASTSVIVIPVIATAVSSRVVALVAAVTTGASLTAFSVTVTVPESESGPPAPALPRSFRVTFRVSVPLRSASGARVSPAASARVAFSSLRVAVTVTVAEPLPMTSPETTPPVTAVDRVRVAPLTDSTSWSSPLPASTSATETPLTTTEVSSFVVSEAGLVRTGASLTAVTVIASVSVSVSAPPAPVLPPSSLVMVSVSAPLKFEAGV